MGLFNWLRSLFGGSKSPAEVKRNVGSLATGDDAEVVEETIDTSGGPLKPDHHRRTVRDKRLLPKAKPKIDPYVWPRPKKPKIMPAEEANRLFSDTMRTNNRDIRDLAVDAEQLERYQLPVWSNEAELAAALGLSESQLRHYSIHRQRETTPHYVTFAVRKRSGGHRLIHAPKQRLKAIQRKLNDLLVSRLPVSEWAHGFRPGRSVATNAVPHVDKQMVVKLDLADCFPSIHFGRIRGLLISLGYSYPVATTLSVLMTESTRQPVAVGDATYHVPIGPRVAVQGAPTSPGICNAVLMRLDRRLAGLARKFGYEYTRHADDLTFSGDDSAAAKRLVHHARQIVEDEGFKLNAAKTRLLRRGCRQRVAGVVVNDQLGLSRTERRQLRAAIHQLDPSDHKTVQRLAGKLAYLAMLNEEQAAPLREALAAKLVA
ncbi:reverse transcriptase family protein [Aeoliella sp.]|uniref:reverse transcriptase family protein n=1 Tax=Aeoliella sp. TaxID=2795800 RepID=UPI003CCBB58C